MTLLVHCGSSFLPAVGYDFFEAKMNYFSQLLCKHESLHIGRGFLRIYTIFRHFEVMVEYRGICADDEIFAFLSDFEKL